MPAPATTRAAPPDGPMDTTTGTNCKESYSGIGLTAGFMGLAIDDDGKFVAVGYAILPDGRQ